MKQILVTVSHIASQVINYTIFSISLHVCLVIPFKVFIVFLTSLISLPLRLLKNLRLKLVVKYRTTTELLKKIVAFD